VWDTHGLYIYFTRYIFISSSISNCYFCTLTLMRARHNTMITIELKERIKKNVLTTGKQKDRTCRLSLVFGRNAGTRSNDSTALTPEHTRVGILHAYGTYVLVCKCKDQQPFGRITHMMTSLHDVWVCCVRERGTQRKERS
jgi:hypothetical protein